VRRVKVLIIRPTRCTNFSNFFLERNSTCFGQFLCPSSGVFHCTHRNSTSYRFADSLQAVSRRNSSVVLPYIFCSLSQEFKTSSSESEFIFGHYCLHFTTTDNQNLTYYYSHIFFLNYEHYNTALGLSL
jgi:hypothetical protein